MKISRNALLVCALQLLLICTAAMKYLYERATRPRIWMEVSQYDPETIMRGRYLALQPYVSACGLEKQSADYDAPAKIYDGAMSPEAWNWETNLQLKDGTLVPVVDSTGDDTVHIRLVAGDDCSRVRAQQSIDLYVPEHAKSPFPLAKGETAWLLATIPPKGAPRAIELAVKKDGVMTPVLYR